MTTIVFRKTLGDIEIAYDTQITQGNAIYRAGSPKVFVNNDSVIGCAGSYAVLGALSHADLPRWSGGSTESFLHLTLLPAIREALAPLGLDAEEKFDLLISVGGDIFESICAKDVFMPPLGWAAIGSGDQFAEGALMAGASVQEALDIAISLDAFTSGAVSTTARTLLGTLPTTGPLLVEAPFEAVAA